MPDYPDSIRAIEWSPAGLVLLDQRALPSAENYLTLTDAAAVACAIRDMVVRGAPAIGITGAYGVALAARQHRAESPQRRRQRVMDAIALLAAARPTAVNLGWALARMQRCLEAAPEEDPGAVLLEEAQRIHAEDIEANRRMGAHGAQLMEAGSCVLTYCNTGSLATGGYGTALGVIRSAWRAGKLDRVFACETRPWLQGARLTAWELARDGIPVTLITDNAAAALMQGGHVHWVVTGADRVTANGDVINKIGTAGLAVLCRHYALRFMVAAPCSTLDFGLRDGRQVEIEERAAGEVLSCNGTQVAAAGAQAWNPVFDVTPAGLVDFLVTEQGSVSAPDRAKLARLQGR